MHNQRHDFVNILEGMAIGSSLGMAAGFLFAPKSGRELRSDFGRRTDRSMRKLARRVRRFVG